MAQPAMLVAAFLALCLLQAGTVLAWYKPAAGHGHYSVGRAAGLLSGLRGAPFARRAETPAGPPPQTRLSLRSLAVCVQDVSPELRRCERLPDNLATFQCKAAVLLSLRADCRTP